MTPATTRSTFAEGVPLAKCCLHCTAKPIDNDWNIWLWHVHRSSVEYRVLCIYSLAVGKLQKTTRNDTSLFSLRLMCISYVNACKKIYKKINRRIVWLECIGGAARIHWPPNAPYTYILWKGLPQAVFDFFGRLDAVRVASARPTTSRLSQRRLYQYHRTLQS